MSLRVPKLDDRTFDDLLVEAKRLVRERCPAWTDLSAGDPGTTLLELYAFLTEVMLYRINRLPEKAYVEFLRLLGVTLTPPGAAAVTLELTRSAGTERRIEVPRGTRVSTARAAEGEDPPVFTTAAAVVLEPEQASARVLAHHCRLIEGEALGVSTGLPGQTFQLRHAPVIAPTGDALDLVVAVEADASLERSAHSLTHDGRRFRIWREVEHFAHAEPDAPVYIADRAGGTITFAPAIRGSDEASANGLSRTVETLAAVPPAERLVCAWYRCGGGPSGNVAAHTLTVLKDPIAGLRVDNPEPAVGGSQAESLENALVRGPQALHSLNRAVTARDYEAVALREGSVARAHAVARAERWRFAAPGTVQLLLVPDVPHRPGAPLSQAQLEGAQTEAALERVRQAVEERRPLGTACVINWYRYKPVAVHARLVLHPQENPRAVRERVCERLNELINPLGNGALRRRLHASDVYHAMLNEPGILYTDRVRFTVDQAPDRDVGVVTVDPIHEGLWYAAAGDRVFRSLDDGSGWEHLAHFEGEQVSRLSCCPYRPGLVAAVSLIPADGTEMSRIRLSEDCGQSWTAAHELGFAVYDAAWLRRDGVPILLLATAEGLFQVPPGSGPVPVLVDENDQGMGFYAVAAIEVPRIGTQVAVAARATDGVYLCLDEELERFHSIGLKGRDVRVLAAQRVGPRAFLWAGLAAIGGEEGDGCLRWELRRDIERIEGWTAMGTGWRGGSCRAIACDGAHVYAATYHAGVVSLDSAGKSPAWRAPRLDCGLPLRDIERLLQRVEDVAVAPRDAQSDRMPMLLCGGPNGVYRSDDGAEVFTNASAREFPERVTVGEGYLFCSAEHQIEAVNDATSGH